MSEQYYPNPHGPSCPWYDLTEKFGAPDIKWCEETLCQWVSEPANTWSNVIFIVIAIILFFRWRKHPFLPLRYAPLGIFLMGIFSLIYHLSNIYISQSLDYLGMFLCIYNLLFINIHRLIKLSKKQYWIAYSLTVIFSMIGMHIAYINTVPVQATILLIVVAILMTEGIAYWRKAGAIHYKNFACAIFFLILGASASALDLKRVLCDPSNHWLQGHAVWHMFTGVMMYFIHMHYESLWNYKKLKQLS